MNMDEYGEIGEDPNSLSCPQRLGSLVPEEPTASE
jgi:hypothetical protein